MSKGEKTKYVVMTAALVPESNDVTNSRLVKEIREEVEKLNIPWVKDVLKVTISDYLFQDT